MAKVRRTRKSLKDLRSIYDYISLDSNWWEALSEDVKKSIDEGLNDIEAGRTIPHSEVLKKYGKSA